MIRFRGGSTNSPSVSPSRPGSSDWLRSSSSRRLFDIRTFRWIILLTIVVVVFFLPWLLATRIMQLMKARQPPPSIELSKYCQIRYPDQTLDFGQNSYFIALNLHNNDPVVTFIIPQVQRIVEALGKDRVFVSIYESGSVDNTGRWVLLYRQYLESRDIPHEIKSDDRVRSRSSHRIDFLATVRNTVMAPLYQGRFKADYVLFINDVFFCAEDAARLSQRVRLGKDVSMACAFDLSLDCDGELGFYDSWVARDMQGASLTAEWPFFTRQADAERLKHGLPVPVYSCWNGLTAIDASVFSSTRFRSAPGDSCLSSECNLFCQDVWEVAPGNLLIDPAVIVAYEKPIVDRIVSSPGQGLGLTSIPVLESFPEHEPRPSSFECYPLVGLDSIAASFRGAPEPVSRQTNFWGFNQKLHLPDIYDKP